MSTRLKSLKRISIPRAYQAVYEALETEILSGRIPRGQVLPTETELAEQFGVTRHTVREGMRVLEQSGLVERHARRRLHVSEPKYDGVASRTSRSLLMQGVSFRELWEIARRLEVCAVELAMPFINDDLIGRLEENVKEMERALEKDRTIVALDVEFHAMIAEATRNRVLLLSREPISQLFYPTLTKLFNHPKTHTVSPRRLVDAHKRIIRAMRNRDSSLALEWMAKHMADFRRGYMFAGISLDDPVDTKIRAGLSA